MSPHAVEIFNPDFKDLPCYVEVSQPYGLSAEWQTPGLYLAKQISSDSSVRFVGEKYESDYLQTIIILDDDPESLLDKIFSMEQRMYEKFKGLRFDVRVKVIPIDKEIDLIKNSTIIHFERK